MGDDKMMEGVVVVVVVLGEEWSVVYLFVSRGLTVKYNTMQPSSS